MPSSAIQLLIPLAAAPAAKAGAANVAATTGEESLAGQAFSQLLGEFGAQTEGEAQQSFAGGSLLQAASIGSVVAQEVPDTSLDGLRALLAQQDEVLTPQNAGVLLGRVEQLLGDKGNGQQQAADGQHALLMQMKEQLQRVMNGEETKTLAEIVQVAMVAVPETKESKFSLAAVFSMLGNKKSANTQKTEEAPTSLAAAVQAMPAAIFRADSGETKAAPTATVEKAQKDPLTTDAILVLDAVPADTVTVVIPLAATTTAMQVAAPVLPVEVNDSANQTIRDMDAVIAPLKLQGEAALPAVELPALAAARSTQAASDASAPSLIAATGALAKEGKTSGEAGVVISDKGLASFANLLNPSHSNGFSPTQTTHAPQPVQLVPTHGLINQAPVTDQVKVAVHQAVKDGVGHITIQLDPVDLGRVEVSMKTNHEGVTQISFMVDKPDTFDGLSRDARFLERSLQEAGIKADTGSMQFNLRQQPQPQLHSDLGGNRQQQNQPDESDDTAAASAIAPAMNFTRNYTIGIREGVDISA
jgi:Flagellar hook-length control protein FliK